MDRRVVALLSLTVLGCAGVPPEPQEPPVAAPPASDEPTPEVADPPPEPAALPPPPSPPQPARRPAPAVTQAVTELTRNPDLHLLLVGPAAERVRTTMVRVARGQIERDRILVMPERTGGSARRLEFLFYVPDGRPLEERFPGRALGGAAPAHSRVK